VIKGATQAIKGTVEAAKGAAKVATGSAKAATHAAEGAVKAAEHTTAAAVKAAGHATEGVVKGTLKAAKLAAEAVVSSTDAALHGAAEAIKGKMHDDSYHATKGAADAGSNKLQQAYQQASEMAQKAHSKGAEKIHDTLHDAYDSASGAFGEMGRKLGMGHKEGYTPEMIKSAKEVLFGSKKATFSAEITARAREILDKVGLDATEHAEPGLFGSLFKKGKDAVTGVYDSAAESADSIASKLIMHKDEAETPERRGWLRAAKDKLTGKEEEVIVNDGRSAVGDIAHAAGEALARAGETLKGAGEQILHADIARERVHTEKRRKH